VAVAEFQADSYMLGQLLNNYAIMAMTKDTNIPILAGDCGRQNEAKSKDIVPPDFDIALAEELRTRNALFLLEIVAWS